MVLTRNLFPCHVQEGDLILPGHPLQKTGWQKMELQQTLPLALLQKDPTGPPFQQVNPAHILTREKCTGHLTQDTSPLGRCREGDLILHDNDIDLAILNPDWDALLEGLKEQLGGKYSLKGGWQAGGWAGGRVAGWLC